MKASLFILVLLAAAACAPRQPDMVLLPTLTPISSCACPTAVSDSTQPQNDAAAHATAICNCPAILITPPASHEKAVLPDGFTRGDNGMNYQLSVGDTFLLNLGAGTYILNKVTYDWTVTIDHPDVIGSSDATTTVLASQGLYTALKPGRATLSAIGVPSCRQTAPVCADSAITFRVTLVVR